MRVCFAQKINGSVGGADMRSRQGGNTRRECNAAFCPQRRSLFLSSTTTTAIATHRRSHTHIYVTHSIISFYFFSRFFLFPSGGARKSLFYGKQHCTVWKLVATQNIRALCRTYILLYIYNRRVLSSAVEKRQWRAKCTRGCKGETPPPWRG